MTKIQADVAVVGGGLAGIVTALELLRTGKSVALLDRDSRQRFGGLALWAAPRCGSSRRRRRGR